MVGRWNHILAWELDPIHPIWPLPQKHNEPKTPNINTMPILRHLNTLKKFETLIFLKKITPWFSFKKIDTPLKFFRKNFNPWFSPRRLTCDHSLKEWECSQFKSPPLKKMAVGSSKIFKHPLFFSQNFQRPPPFTGSKFSGTHPLKKNTFKTSLYNVYIHIKHIYFLFLDTCIKKSKTPPFLGSKFSKTLPPIFQWVHFDCEHSLRCIYGG